MNITGTDSLPAKPGNWTPIRVYAAYRTFLTLLLLGIFLLTQPRPLLGQFLPDLFTWTIWLYLLFALADNLLVPRFARLTRVPWLLAGLIIDIGALTLLIHASGGIGSSPSILLLVSVAAANILLPGRMGLLVAALATISVIFEQFYYSVSLSYTNPFELTESGLFGLSFFAVSLIIQQIVQRLVHSEALTEEQKQQIQRLEELNRQIVERMRTGILVFDADYRIIVCNHSAQNIFGESMEGKALPASIREIHRQWQYNPERSHDPFFVSSQSQAINAGFALLGDAPDSPTIAFLEERSRMVQEAQQLKLASLGRMSATIAHEIRNPLSAIRHAAALLNESSRDPEDQHLLQIVETHVNRVNAIINDILNISRRPAGRVELRRLLDIVGDFRQAWKNQGNNSDRLRIMQGPAATEVRFDMLQLQQVLENLVGNAFRHGGPDVEVRLEWGLHSGSGLPWLSICDNGPGIPESDREHLFEPFFTTSREGSGLGLFVCRELCEANQARLDYRGDGDGACFVITFSHPDKVFE